MKRTFDIILSISLILLFSPVFIMVTLTILFLQGRPIIFKQDRLSKNHMPFKIIKFCTMSRKKDKNGKLLKDKDRITKLGSFLRKTSIDELPSFWNVLKGEMSIVGPRPLRVRYLGRYSTEQDRRHEVKSGITGLAQINGRNALTWEERFRLDVEYVNNQSFLLDMKILFITIFVVLLNKNINSSENTTMDEFLGNDNCN